MVIIILFFILFFLSEVNSEQDKEIINDYFLNRGKLANDRYSLR